MTSKLSNLTGYDKPLVAEPPDRAEYEGDLDIDLRLVTDMVTATQAVAAAVQQLAPVEG